MKRSAFATLTIALFVLITSGLTSCKKDKDEKKTQEINLQTVSGDYKISALTYKEGNQPEEDEYALMDACEKDNVLKFKSDKTYNYVDAGTQCTPPADDSGLWDVPSSTKFVLDGDDWVLESYDGKILKISYSEVWGGVTEVTKITFNKQ